MKVGDMFVFTDHNLKIMDVGLIDTIDVSNPEMPKLTIQNYWPEDNGELRQFPISSPYFKRSQQIFHSKNPGTRIKEVRHRMIELICNGSVRV